MPVDGAGHPLLAAGDGDFLRSRGRPDLRHRLQRHLQRRLLQPPRQPRPRLGSLPLYAPVQPLLLTTTLPTPVLPLLVVAVTSPFIFKDYVSWFSCWINVETQAFKAPTRSPSPLTPKLSRGRIQVEMVPIIFVAWGAVVGWEAASSYRGRLLPRTDRQAWITSLFPFHSCPTFA